MRMRGCPQFQLAFPIFSMNLRRTDPSAVQNAVDGAIQWLLSVLLNHLESFTALMMIQEPTDILYLAFPAMLRKSAQVWYSSL